MPVAMQDEGLRERRIRKSQARIFRTGECTEEGNRESVGSDRRNRFDMRLIVPARHDENLMAVVDVLTACVRRIGASVACLRRREADAVSVMVVVMGNSQQGQHQHAGRDQYGFCRFPPHGTPVDNAFSQK